MPEMSPQQEALQALDHDLPRSGLSAAAQLEYDRFKPVWEPGVPAEFLQAYAGASTAMQRGPGLASPHLVDRSGTTHTFRHQPLIYRALGPVLVFAAVLIVLGIANAESQSFNIWSTIAWICVAPVPCAWFGIRLIRAKVQVRDGKLIVCNVLRNRTFSASEISAITLDSNGGSIWWPLVHLANGIKSVMVDGVVYITAPEPPTELARTVDEIRALLGIHTPTQDAIGDDTGS